MLRVGTAVSPKPCYEWGAPARWFGPIPRKRGSTMQSTRPSRPCYSARRRYGTSCAPSKWETIESQGRSLYFILALGFRQGTNAKGAQSSWGTLLEEGLGDNCGLASSSILLQLWEVKSDGHQWLQHDLRQVSNFQVVIWHARGQIHINQEDPHMNGSINKWGLFIQTVVLINRTIRGESFCSMRGILSQLQYIKDKTTFHWPMASTKLRLSVNSPEPRVCNKM